jgi:hypothetical protein
MQDYLISTNPSGRLIIDLQGGTTLLDREEIGLAECPDCAAQWSDSCPFCRTSIAATWHGHQAHCSLPAQVSHQGRVALRHGGRVVKAVLSVWPPSCGLCPAKVDWVVR